MPTLCERKRELQPPLTVEEQIQNLKELNLHIEDEEEARRLLNDISYFRLIKAFSLGLKPKNGKYNDGISFNQIVELYKFNCDFRQILFPIIERIEVNLRCRVANYFSEKYGVLGYEYSMNFADREYHESFLEDIELEISRNEKSPFVKNFINHYSDGKIPMYALVELFSFGTLSKFYKNMKNPDKKAIAQSYGVGYTYLESWVESIAYVRNLCAHYGRLYNAKIPKRPRLYKEYIEAGITDIRVFGILVCISRLVFHDVHWINFVERLEKLIQKYPNVKIDTMGFPPNWKEFLIKQ